MAGFYPSDLTGATDYVLQSALSAYTDEAYLNARKLSGTGIVGDNPLIDTGTETFVGQLRWFKNINPTINTAIIDGSGDGQTSSYSSDYLKYIKTVRTYGASKVNMQEVVTQVDGLAKHARDFAEIRNQDEHDAIMAVLKGVATSELLNGASYATGANGLGGISWTSDPKDKKYGFYADFSNKYLVSPAGKETDGTTANLAYQGAQRAEMLLQALGMGWRDYEPEYVYLVCSPKTLMSFRSANLVDQTRVTEGNLMFESIFNGKFRLIQTRANQAFSDTELARINDGPGVNLGAASSVDCTFLVRPGALAMKSLLVPTPVEIDRDPKAMKGGGTTSIWYRWGYVLAPAGYDWVGPETAFPENSGYSNVRETATWKTLATVTATTGSANCIGAWNRKASSALSLGILPVLHK